MQTRGKSGHQLANTVPLMYWCYMLLKTHPKGFFFKQSTFITPSLHQNSRFHLTDKWIWQPKFTEWELKTQLRILALLQICA